jgi:hypothetical protein
MYPSQVRRWIANRGGLTPRMIFLRGTQLTAMYRPCDLGAQAERRKDGPETEEANVGSSKAQKTAGVKAVGYSSR